MKMAKGEYKGRLQVDDGDLQAGEGPHQGASVYHDLDEGGYFFVQEGEPNHFDRHHKNYPVAITGTSGPLFDADGKMVYPGDPHHFEPSPTDPHYNADAPNKTKTIDDEDVIGHKNKMVPRLPWLPDDHEQQVMEVERGNPEITGHTEAYRG
jgi:hypothetical protein